MENPSASHLTPRGSAVNPHIGRSHSNAGLSGPSDGRRGAENSVASHGAQPASSRGRRSQRRAKQRAKANGGADKGPLKQVVYKRLSGIVKSKSFTSTNLATTEITVSKKGWLGSRKQGAPEPELTLADLLARPGWELLGWDGINPHLVLDKSGRIVAVLAGRARGSFQDVLDEATALFQRHSQSLPPVEDSAVQPAGKPRGDFHAVVTGVSYGGGQMKPTCTRVPALYQAAVKELTESDCMKRLAGFQNRAFQAFFPKTHAYYVTRLSTLYELPDVRRPYEGSIMPAAAFNLGPATACRPHRDAANLSFGICSITALGRFDPTIGGHMVLHELKLAIRFPPGSTVLIPSAFLTHSNTGLRTGETRYSFTQYAAGSLFSYIENGLKSSKDVAKNLSKDELQTLQQQEESGERWRDGLALLSHVNEYYALDVGTRATI